MAIPALQRHHKVQTKKYNRLLSTELYWTLYYDLLTLKVQSNELLNQVGRFT